MLPEVVAFGNFGHAIQACEGELRFAVLNVVVKIALPGYVNSNLSSLTNTQKHTGTQRAEDVMDCT